MYFTFSCGGTQKCVQNGKKMTKIFCLSASQKAGTKTPCVWKMQIIPPPLAAALHRSSHMLLYKLFTYNGGLYQAATRLFRIQIKRLDFRPPRGKRRNLCGHKRPQLRHIIYCAWRFSDVKEAFDLGRCCGEAGWQFTKSMTVQIIYG